MQKSVEDHTFYLQLALGYPLPVSQYIRQTDISQRVRPVGGIAASRIVGIEDYRLMRQFAVLGIEHRTCQGESLLLVVENQVRGLSAYVLVAGI